MHDKLTKIGMRMLIARSNRRKSVEIAFYFHDRDKYTQIYSGYSAVPWCNCIISISIIISVHNRLSNGPIHLSASFACTIFVKSLTHAHTSEREYNDVRFVLLMFEILFYVSQMHRSMVINATSDHTIQWVGCWIMSFMGGFMHSET